ncbi:MAG: energy transducer TonB [Bryobacteraceae bacterium]
MAADLKLDTFVAVNRAQASRWPRQHVRTDSFAGSNPVPQQESPGGEVRSAMFNVREPDSGSSAGRSIRGSGFAEAKYVAATASTTGSSATPPVTRDVEILSKPKPEYTDEGRRRQVQGEVVLEILFTRAAQVKILRVVRSLGFGLDEAAIAAAAGMRFRPADQHGVPVDSTAIVHIRFELAF